MDMVAGCSQPRTSYRRFEAAVAQRLRYPDYGRHVMSLSPVPLKTRRVNLSRAEMSSHWCGVVVRRGVPAQVSSRHDHGSKLRGPSPSTFV
ncbi:hypothetical protein TNCV_3662721 [Trichonephila clavipes]|nr:hypothetical protein TNCV_3662721 [Trichonephila clavipes]